MSKQTPEPWVFSPDRHTHDCFIHAANAEEKYGYIDNDDGGVFGSSEWNWFKDEDAKRTVACVNACAGINPEAVPDVVEALREAINWAEGYAQGGVIPEYLKAARAALAKLEDVS